MEYDSGSSCEGRLKDLEKTEAFGKTAESNNRAEREVSALSSASLRWYNLERTPSAGIAVLPTLAKRTLSSQVMEYYHKYSQNSTLGRYFSSAEPGSSIGETNIPSLAYTLVSDPRASTESYAVLGEEERFRQDSSIPRERRRWARPPPLRQQPPSDDVASTDSRTPSPISRPPVNETIPEERNESSRETLVEPRENEAKPSISPASSVASHKPLEWDSGADVGYYNALLPRTKEKEKNLCTIERMALARGRSIAMRLDPEGTNESTVSSRIVTKNNMRPDANSTPLTSHISAESESEIEITPIVKNHGTAMMKIREDVSPEVCSETTAPRADDRGDEKKSKLERALPIKYPTEGSRSREAINGVQSSPLKKSSSMNLLALPFSRLSLKRSQSELNLRGREKTALPLIFDSTSSIATVVNKPLTCDKFIQTSLNGCSRESIGIQVEVTSEEIEKSNGEMETETEDNRVQNEPEDDKEEEKPPLPKRASSLAQKSLHSILKNSSNTYNARDRSVPVAPPANHNVEEKRIDAHEEDYPQENEDRVDGGVESRARYRIRGGGRASECNSSSEPSKNESSEILVEETTEENANGRASNSFEYFPGHVYQNVPNGSTSQVSSCDTGLHSRCSTMPNTSSSIDEKLWGDSESLVRDLERSVNILKSLVDANKCDKQVKKRLIHHVIKRLVTAKYTDDRIEHDLEENVPWNPADTRNKVYRNDIIQALANSKQRNTTDSSEDDWRPRKRNVARANSGSPKKTLSKETRALKEMYEIAASSRASTINSDKFPFDRHTDRTVMDGRKARMGLRSEDQRRSVNTDGEKSQSSECFVPQLQNQHSIKSTNLFYSIDKKKEKTRESTGNVDGEAATSLTPTTTTTTSSTSATSNSTSHRNPISNRIVLIKDRKRTDSNETDWRLPTTMSERRFELGQCSNSESGDAKLINYAEMEKRNQIVWITNEISHLCNLKRLLEEPKKIESRSRSGSSPRKRLGTVPTFDQWIVRAHIDKNSSSRPRATESEAAAEDSQRDESLEKGLENQWSSHGNLASGRSEERATTKREEDRLGPTRKRNSCTQTGNDGGPSGHSKTGGEIVSATLPILASATSARIHRDGEHVLRDASVQARIDSPERISNRIPTAIQSNADPTPRIGHPSTCPTRVVKSESSGDEKTCPGTRRHVCYCQRYAAHSRHRACIIHSPQRSARPHSTSCPRKPKSMMNERPIITQPIVAHVPASGSKSVDSRKEAKNQLNATCRSNYAIREIPGRDKARCATCEGEQISSTAEVPPETSRTAEKSSKRDVSTDICVCSRDCNCDDEEREDSTGNEDWPEKDDRIGKPCGETGSERENETHRGGSASSFSRCVCYAKEHPSSNREAGGSCVYPNSRRTVPTTEISSIEKTCRSCRTCGKIWPLKDGKNVNRKCKCSQDYLKPVAYELKFDETKREKPKKAGRKKTTKTDKIVTESLSTTTKNQSKGAAIVEKSDGKYPGDEDEEEDDNIKDENSDEDKSPGTLKDFLETNKPEFLENVETRRRYMSELSQIRQLKREKRKQFLAMAGASVLINPSRPLKGPTANSQRKISEYEMKLRLRMRYLRLNEVRNKRCQRQKEEDLRRNHLMAKLFGRKLQQKVLRGQVDLSQSVSVISNL